MKLNTNAMEVLADELGTTTVVRANDTETANPVVVGRHLFTSDRLINLESGNPGGETPPSTAGETPAATAAGIAAEEGQLELGLRASAGGRPRRVVRARRYAVARWWFARMRETVRSTREWNGSEVRGSGTEQALLTLSQSPTRFEGRRAA